jgi:putative RNA 2'-phosphotransferase
MTHPALIERITRSLAYMLRHQPERFDLELDPHGYGDIQEVVRALNERLGEPVTAEDLEIAIRSGDRPRYEIKGDKVRALYGHSIDVEPGEPAQPPELLYVGLSARDAERAQRYGLRGGRRRFLHLARTPEGAREAGRRAGVEYSILTVYALDAWEEGINFYDRQALFLADGVPAEFLEVTDTFSDGYEPLAHDGHGGEGDRRQRPPPRRGRPEPFQGERERPRELARETPRELPPEGPRERPREGPREQSAGEPPRERELHGEGRFGDRRGPRGRRGGRGRREGRREPVTAGPAEVRGEAAPPAESQGERLEPRHEPRGPRPERREHSHEGRGPRFERREGPPRERREPRREEPRHGRREERPQPTGQPTAERPPAREGEPAAAGGAGTSFGLGVFEPPAAKPSPAPAPRQPAPPPVQRERRPEREPEPAPQRAEPGEAPFGAGI